MSVFSTIKSVASKVPGVVGKAFSRFKGLQSKANDFGEMIKKKIKLYAIGVGLAFLLVACIILLLENFFGTSAKAASYKVSSSLKETADSRALDLYDKYGSYLGFTLSEISDVRDAVYESLGYSAATDTTSEKTTDSYLVYSSRQGRLTVLSKSSVVSKYENRYDDNGNILTSAIPYIEFYETSKEGKFTDAISDNDNLSIYEHILRSEKYQFNEITWMVYTHDGGANELSSSSFTYDSNLGLIYPTGTDVYEFMELVSPYLMSNIIPAAYLSQGIYSAQTKSTMGTSVTENYYSSEYGESSDAANFAYQVIKHAKSEIIINNYELQQVNVTSSWYEYNDYSCSDNYVITRTEKEVYYEDEDGNEISYLIPSDSTTSYTLTSYSSDYESDSFSDDNKGEFHNTRLNDAGEIDYDLEEDRITDGPYVYDNTQYKLASALAFDVRVTNSYNYETYDDDDVEHLRNANSASEETAEPYKELKNVTNHYTQEQVQLAIEILNGDASWLTITSEEAQQLAQKIENTSCSSSGSDPVRVKVADGVYKVTKTTTYTYNISESYTAQSGTKKTITRTWSDTLEAEPTSTKKVKLGINDVINFNKNSEEDPTKSTVSSDDFKADSESLAYYVALADEEGTSINAVDMLDSNRKIFLNYTSSMYTYVGYGRSEYTVEKGNSLITSSFQDLADNNDGTLPFVYGESFGFDTGAEEASGLSSSSGKQLLYEYINHWEGSGTTKEEDGVKYYQVYTISGNRTVGHGLDLETSGREDELIELANRLGYSISTSVGSWIPADIVDEITNEIVEDMYSYVVSETQGLNLKEYQIYALVSRCYNCGKSGGLSDIESTYNAYWNSETDDKYEELFEIYGTDTITTDQENDINTYVDFNNSFYTERMSTPVTSKGEYLEGLENRRKSEWALFQTGYFGYNTDINKFYSEGGGSIIECAEYVHAYMEENNYTYCVYGGNSYEECATFSKSHGLDSTFEESKTNHQNTCCATFVSWVLEEAGYMDTCIHGAANLANYLENTLGFTRITDKTTLEAGDILVYNYGSGIAHIAIYAGDGTVYNAGSGSAIRGDAPAKYGDPANNSDIVYGLRAPY